MNNKYYIGQRLIDYIKEARNYIDKNRDPPKKIKEKY